MNANHHHVIKSFTQTILRSKETSGTEDVAVQAIEFYLMNLRCCRVIKCWCEDVHDIKNIADFPSQLKSGKEKQENYTCCVVKLARNGRVLAVAKVD